MPFSKAEVIRSILRILPIPVSVIVGGIIVSGGSVAAFSGTSSDGGSGWNAAKVTIGDSSKNSFLGSELFRDRKVFPGYRESRCVTVISNSSVPTRAKMYGINVSDIPLTEAMTMEIDQGAVDPDKINQTSCSTFKDAHTIYSGNLAGFGREATDYGHGLSAGPDGDHLAPGGRTTYRITLELPKSADNSVAGRKGEATFKWEAQG